MGALLTSITSCNLNKQEITGFITVIDADGVEGKWDRCKGKNGYDDIAEGKNITFKNQDGKIIGGASWENLDKKGVSLWKQSGNKVSDLKEYESVSCTLYFTTVLNEKPEALLIDNGIRGQNTFTKTDLDKKKWVLNLEVS